MKVFLYLILLIFPFGQLLRMDLTNFVSGLVVQPIDLLVLLFNFAWGVELVRRISKPEKDLSFWLFKKEILLFVCLCTLSFLINIPNYGFNLSSFFYLLRLFNLSIFFWAFCSFLKRTKINIIKILFFEGVIISAVSLILYVFIPDTRFLFNFGWDLHYFRAIGPFLDPSFNGLICVFSFFIFVHLISEKKKQLKDKLLLSFGGMLILFSIALSFSRLDYLVLLIGLGIMLFSKRTVKYLAILTSVFIFVVLLLPKPTGEGVDLLRKSSFISRFDNYKHATQVIKDNFLFGVGFNNYRFAQKDNGLLNRENWQTSHSGGGADNSFLFVFATTGVFGFVAFLYLWFKIIKRMSVLDKERRKIVLPTLIGLLLSSFFVNSLFYPWVLLWLFMILGESFIVQGR